MRLLFIRHGQTDTNILGLTHYTHDFSGLSEEGKQQAKNLASVCKAQKIEKLFSSPAKRALETTQWINEKLNVATSVLPDLTERRWGKWAGRPWADIHQALSAMTIEQRYTFIPPDGESWQQMEARLRNVLSNLVSQSLDRLAVITHGGVLSGLMHVIQPLSKEQTIALQFDNASITTISYKENCFKVLSINETNHLQIIHA